jgi:5-methylcytosine-specific restriction endonuclease McrA
MMRYQDYLKSDDWQRKRVEKLTRDSGTRRRCAICGSEKNLHIHHLNYMNLFNAKQSDLRILCKRCHFLAHDLYKEGRIRFNSKNHHSRFTILKSAVKKALGKSQVNMFLDRQNGLSIQRRGLN